MRVKFRRYHTIIVLIVLSVNISAQYKEYNILDFGAVPDGITNNSNAIQSAINEVSANGGGRVIIPPGSFMSGSLFIKSGVTLHVELGARLLGSDKHADYDTLAFIFSRGRKNIGISGKGVFDGQAGGLIKDIFIKLQNGTLDDK